MPIAVSFMPAIQCTSAFGLLRFLTVLPSSFPDHRYLGPQMRVGRSDLTRRMRRSEGRVLSELPDELLRPRCLPADQHNRV